MSLRQGGIRKRLAGVPPEPIMDAPRPSASSSSSGRGVRARLADCFPEVARDESRRSGGITQRLGTAAGPPVLGTQKNAPLNNALMRDWCKGELPSNKALEYASKAVKQGATRVGRMGGEQPDDRHAHRAMVSALGFPSAAPEIEWIDVLTSRGLKPMPIVCPIATFRKLAADAAKFERAITGKPGEIRAFWEGLSGHSTCPEGVDDQTAAAGMHGDGAPTTKVDGLFSIAWNSLHATGTTKETRQLYAVIRKSDIIDGTLNTYWDRLAWSLNALQVGRIPARDWLGKRRKDAGQIIAGGGSSHVYNAGGTGSSTCRPLGSQRVLRSRICAGSAMRRPMALWDGPSTGPMLHGSVPVVPTSLFWPSSWQLGGQCRGFSWSRRCGWRGSWSMYFMLLTKAC